MKYLLIFSLALFSIYGYAQNHKDYPVPAPQLKADSTLSRYSEQEVVTIGDVYIYLRMNMRPLNGIVFKNWSNGVLMSECAYRSGLLYGLCKNWYRSGQIKSEGNFINGNKDGLWREWHQNGQLSTEENYTNGKKDGVSRLWFEDGQLWEEEVYKNGEVIVGDQ